jgi:hypothetical protein
MMALNEAPQWMDSGSKRTLYRNVFKHVLKLAPSDATDDDDFVNQLLFSLAKEDAVVQETLNGELYARLEMLAKSTAEGAFNRDDLQRPLECFGQLVKCTFIWV